MQRYFWHYIAAIGLTGLVVFVFFVFSLKVKDGITYTDEGLTAPTITIADPSIGPGSAKVTIVDFGDYQCDSCADVEEALVNLREVFPDDVRVVWKDMPNTSSHPEALNAAIAARCAGEQDAFWEYHEALFANQSSIASDIYSTLASNLQLKASTFSSCFTNQSTAPLVQKSFEEGLALDISATPTLFINGQRYTGAMDLASLKAIVRPLTQ